MELKSEDLKNAIAAKLLQIIPDCTVYKTEETKLKYPHFFIQQISVSDDEWRRGRHLLDYSFDLRYRIISDPSMDKTIGQKLDAMGMKLLASLKIIDCGDDKIRLIDRHYEKTDGVLHFFANAKVQTLLINKSETTPKQQKLGVEIGVKNG